MIFREVSELRELKSLATRHFRPFREGSGRELGNRCRRDRDAALGRRRRRLSGRKAIRTGRGRSPAPPRHFLVYEPRPAYQRGPFGGSTSARRNPVAQSPRRLRKSPSRLPGSRRRGAIPPPQADGHSVWRREWPCALLRIVQWFGCMRLFGDACAFANRPRGARSMESRLLHPGPPPSQLPAAGRSRATTCRWRARLFARGPGSPPPGCRAPPARCCRRLWPVAARRRSGNLDRPRRGSERDAAGGSPCGGAGSLTTEPHMQ